MQHLNRLLILTIAILLPLTTTVAEDVSAGSSKAEALSNPLVTVQPHGNTLSLLPTAKGSAEKKVTIPRLNAPLKSMAWKNNLSRELKFTPEIDHWVWTWTGDAQGDTIEVVLDGELILPADAAPITPAADGILTLPACHAKTFGEKLRYEPQWYKNTVGYWTGPKDYAEWTITIVEPGQYSVAVLQGLGTSQGGSEASLSLRQGDEVTDEITFEPIETGHFQNFRWVHLGMIEVTKPGDYQIRIEPRKIAKAALMDVRAVHLGKQAKEVK